MGCTGMGYWVKQISSKKGYGVNRNGLKGKHVLGK